MPSSTTNLRIISLTLDVAGTLLLAISILIMHARMLKQQRIDTPVLNALKIEFWLSLVALVLIAIGFVMVVYTEVVSDESS